MAFHMSEYDIQGAISDSCFCTVAPTQISDQMIERTEWTVDGKQQVSWVDYDGVEMQSKTKLPFIACWGKGFYWTYFHTSIMKLWVDNPHMTRVGVFVAGNDIYNERVNPADLGKWMKTLKEDFIQMGLDVIIFDCVPANNRYI